MSAGEFGHLVIEAGGPECECGRRGCVEAVQQRALAEGDIERAAAAVATGIANVLHIVDVPGVVWSGSHLEAHPQACAAALAAELQRTLAGGAAYAINRAMPMDVPQDDRPADLVATVAAVMVLESVYGFPHAQVSSATAIRHSSRGEAARSHVRRPTPSRANSSMAKPLLLRSACLLFPPNIDLDSPST